MNQPLFYIFSLVANVVATYLLIRFHLIIPEALLLLFLLIITAIAAAYRGFRAGIFLTLSFGIASAVYIYIIMPHFILAQHGIESIQLLLFVINGMIISSLIGRTKQLDEEIILSEARKTAVQDAAIDIILALDRKGNIIDANAAVSFLGMDRDQIIGRKIQEIIAPESMVDAQINFPTLLQKYERALIGKRLEMIAKHTLGHIIPVEFTLSKIRVRSQTVYAAYIRDITKQKNNEADYNNLLQSERDAKAQAQKAILMRDEFLSIASHELRTPLTSMLLQLQSVLHSIKHVSLANFSIAELLRLLESTERQSNRLSKMISDLLNVSLITTGRLNLELEEANLSEVIKQTLDGFAEKMTKDNYEVSTNIEENVKAVIDKLRIEQVISNLITNAMKYGNNKSIEIFLKQEQDRILIMVKDHGIGIPPEKQQQIFARFERGVTSKEYKGLGVGLYISNQIILSHSGRINVVSIPNQETVFIVELPKPKANIS